MARGRRGRRSRSKQRSKGAGTRSSKAKSSKSRSKNTRGSGARNNRKSAPSKRRTTRTTSQRTNQRGVGAKNRGRTGINASRGKPPTSRRQATRTTRQARPTKINTRVAQNQGPSTPVKNYGGNMGIQQNFGAGRVNNVRPKPGFKLSDVFGIPTAFGNALMGIQAANAQGPSTPKLTREEKIKAAFPGASPNSPIFGMSDAQLSQPGGPFNQAGPTPENTPESDYTSYKPGSFYNQSDTNMNPTNFLRSTRNVITTPARMLGINNRLTNKLIPKSNEAIQDSRDQRGPRPTLKRRGGSGGASRIQQQAAATQMQPEIAPTIGQPLEETGAAPMDNSELTRIQSQAYNTQLTSSLAGMFGGQGSVGYVPQGDTALSPTLRAGQSRGRRRVRMFGARRRTGGTGDQFSRAGDRIAKLTNINI